MVDCRISGAQIRAQGCVPSEATLLTCRAAVTLDGVNGEGLPLLTGRDGCDVSQWAITVAIAK
jgi:hypothetical protein